MVRRRSDLKELRSPSIPPLTSLEEQRPQQRRWDVKLFDWLNAHSSYNVKHLDARLQRCISLSHVIEKW